MKRKKNWPFEIRITEDGSPTLYSHHYQESYHSLGGAFTEARERFVEPCRIGELGKTQPSLSILDIGFGMGFNIAATLSALRALSFSGDLFIISLEKDETLLEFLSQMESPAGFGGDYQWIHRLASEREVSEGKIHLKILLGPGEKTIERVEGPFDAIYLDPFSPAKNPELWEGEFCRKIYDRLSPQGILSTYSSAVRVRLALMEGGFKIGKGPRAAGKSSGTLASKEYPLPPFDEKYWRKINRRFIREFGRPYA